MVMSLVVMSGDGESDVNVGDVSGAVGDDGNVPCVDEL